MISSSLSWMASIADFASMVPVSVKLDAQLQFIDLKGPFSSLAFGYFWALAHLYFDPGDPGDPGASASTTTLLN